MALFIRPLFTPQSTICRRFGIATTHAGRKKNEKLELPKDKTGIIIGKRKQAVYYPKVFSFLKNGIAVCPILQTGSFLSRDGL